MNEEANEQTEAQPAPREVLLLLLNGMQFGPLPLVTNALGVVTRGSITLAPKVRGGKAREIETERLIPWTAIAAVDFLPEEVADAVEG